MPSLGESLPLQQARVRKLILEYRHQDLNGAGEFAAALIEASLQRADQAVMSGDCLAMIEAYQDLKGYE